MEILVVGCGVSGLSCAIELREAGYPVRIVARDLPPNTTSDVAAAVWYPIRGEREARVDRWLPVSFERFCVLAKDTRTGVVLRGGIELFRSPADETWWGDVLPGFRRARGDELPARFADGFVAEGVPVIEMPVYLRWLMTRFTGLGGVIEPRTLASLDDAVAGNDVVVDCSGVGARDLAGDGTVVPVRGQVVRVRQFGLERYVLDEQNPGGVTYIYPRANDVVLGGTREADDWSLEPRAGTARAILDRCARLVPRVRDVPIVSHGVGLRPGRPSVRLEAEERRGRLVVHDYGHGGSGVTLSWGCARDVLALIRERVPAPRVDSSA